MDSGRSASYTYDPLYRLLTATTAGSANYPAWGLSQTYDRYGNRSAQTAIPGAGCVAITCPQPSFAVSASTNRLIGSPYAYDLSGNMTNDGINTLVYDAENHATSATNGSSSGTYTYDGNGQRVKKVSGGTTIVTIFFGGQVLAEYNNGAAPSSPTNEYIYAGNMRVASIQSGTTNYWHNDHLSPRVRTDTSGNVSDQRGTFPFGETWYSPGASPYMFTTYYRDYEAAGNDYAQARSYVGGLGRFSSPDLVAGSTSDPQSLNRYSYVRNMPVMLTDPFGTCPGGLAQNRDSDSNHSQDSKSGGPSNSDSDSTDPQGIGSSIPPGPCPGFTAQGGGGGGVSIDGGETGGPGSGLGSGGSGYPVGDGDVWGLIQVPVRVGPAFIPGEDWGDRDLGFGLFYLALGPGGGNSGGDLIGDTLKKLQKLLKLDPKCSSFLSGNGTDVQTELSGILDNHLYGQTEIVPTKNDDGTLTMNNAISFGYIPGQAITVNTIGAFFNSTYQGLPLTTDRKRISGGTPAAQGFILLHELGHLTDALKPDFNKQTVIDQNDRALEQHCKDLIKSLSK